jgi:hypothetical protein
MAAVKFGEADKSDELETPRMADEADNILF